MTNWQDKALTATKGTQLGAILHAALGVPKEAPYFAGQATVTSDGFVIAGFADKNGEYHYGAFVGSTEDLYRNLGGLAAHLKLTNHKELLNIVDKWMGVK